MKVSGCHIFARTQPRLGFKVPGSIVEKSESLVLNHGLREPWKSHQKCGEIGKATQDEHKIVKMNQCKSM